MAGKNYADTYADMQAGAAGANVNAAYGVTPQAAITGLQSGPAVGVDPSLAMHDPQQVSDLHQQLRENAALGHPTVQSFAASASPATVAATRGSWPEMAGLADTITHFFGQGLRSGAIGAVQQATDLILGGRRTLPGTPGVPGAGDILGVVGRTALQSAFGAPTQPKTLLQRGAQTLGEFAPFALVPDSALGRILNVAGPAFGTEAGRAAGQAIGGEKGAQIGAQVGGVLGGLGAGARFAGKGGFGPRPTAEPPPPAAFGGAPHVGPEGPTLNPEGFVLDSEGAPAGFASSRDAAMFIFSHMGDAAGEFKPYNADGVWGVQRTPGSESFADAAPAAHADMAAEAAKVVEERVASMPHHSEVPEATEEFLGHTELAGRSVWVDPRAILAQHAEGHDPFPDHAEEVSAALATGREVELPAPTYFAAVSGKPYADAIREATRFSEDGVSQAEAGEQRPPAAGAVRPAPTIPSDIPPELHEPLRALAAKADSAVDQVFQSMALDQFAEDNKALGLTKGQYELYNSMIEEAKAAASDRVLQRTYDQIRRERTPEWQTAVAQHTAGVEQELAKSPLLHAYSALTRSKGVLGEPLEASKLRVSDGLSAWGKDLGLPKSMFAKDGLTADQLAGELGYPSGAQMVRELGALKEIVGDRSFADYLKETVREHAANLARGDLGYDISPEGLARAAHEAAVLPQIADFLAKDLVDLGRVVGRPINPDDVKAAARKDFGGLRIEEAANPKVFEKAVKRTGERALRALEKGDFPSALVERWQQLLNFHQLKLSWEFKREVAKGDKLLDKWGRKKVIGAMDPTIGAVLQQTANVLGHGDRRDSAELQRFLAQAASEGRATTLPDIVSAAQDMGYPLEEADLIHQGSSVEDYRAMLNMLKGVAEVGKELHQITAGAKVWELAAYANEVQANADVVGRKYTGQELLDYRRSAYRRLASQVKTLLIGNLRPEVYLHWADGSRQGPLMRGVVNPLMEGKYSETRLTDQWIKAMKAAAPKGFFASMDTKLEVPDFMMVPTASDPVHVIETKGNLRVALLHLGSESARSKLLEGFGWGDAQEKWLKAQITEDDKTFAKAFWAQNEVLFDLADKMYGRVRGYGLVADPAQEVKFEDGSVLAGGHIHITYNQTLKTLTQMQGVEGLMAAKGKVDMGGGGLLDEHPVRAMPSAFYGVRRTGYVGPVNLDPRMLSAGISEIIHDISYREPMIQAQKVLTDPRVREALMSVLGPEYNAHMMPWLKYIAQERMLVDPALENGAQLVRNLNSNIVFAKVAFRMSSALRHAGIGGAHMLRAVGSPKVLACAASDLIGPKGGEWRQFVQSNSGEVAGIAWNLDTSLRDGLARDALSDGRIDDAKAAGYYMFTMFKNMEAHVTWLGKYRTEMARVGDHELAVAEANKTVRDTQGAGAPVDTAPLLRHHTSAMGEAMRGMAGMLMNFHGTGVNMLWTAKRELGQMARAAGRGEAGEAASHGAKAGGILLAAVLAPALIVAIFDIFIAGGGDPRKSKEENAEDQFLWGVADQTAGSLVGVNMLTEMAHYGKDHGSGLLGGTMADLVSVPDPHNTHAFTTGVKVAGALTGVIPDAAVDLADATIDASTDQYPFASHTFIQRGFLGREGKEGGSGSPRRSRPARAHRAARGSGTL